MIWEDRPTVSPSSLAVTLEAAFRAGYERAIADCGKVQCGALQWVTDGNLTGRAGAKSRPIAPEGEP